MKKPTKGFVVSVQEKLPPANCRVIVVCHRFRCLGYLDDQGVWRDDLKSQELAEVIGWMPFSGLLEGPTPLPRSEDGP
jgi:hypothetical protein